MADFPQIAAFGTVYLDAGSIDLPLAVRHFRPGDRFWPQGGPGTRKLQDFLVDRKIPRWLRPHLPLVESRGRIILVAGLALAEPVRLTQDTAKAVSLQIVPAGDYATRVWEILRAWLSQAHPRLAKGGEAPGSRTAPRANGSRP
jgi:tRNA(Ile)-lysidine synthetase-like protein